MRIERIDTDEIIGLTCPVTGNRILWDDENIEDALRGSVVSAIIASVCPEECGFDWMPMAAAWNEHYASTDARKLTLDEVVEAFPAKEKALKVVSGGIACGPVCDVTYFVVPYDLSEECFIRTGSDEDAEGEAGE